MSDGAAVALLRDGDPAPRPCLEHTMKPPELNSQQQGNGAHLSDVATLRARARQEVVCGAVTRAYGADRDTVVRILNEALATELVCTLRYRCHYFMASGIEAESVRQEFLEHAREDLEHADRI